ncbi:MAG: ECF transporter S component [Lachnospiraceae bacterium]|nr:ECF transporter S component [Lachnospiraceae bacterium]
MNELWENIATNVVFVVEFLLLMAAMFVIAYVFEKISKKRRGDTTRILTTRKVAMIGMLSAIAAVLMLIEVPMPFAPGFYKLDLSELPILIGTFAFGPVAGVMIEMVKIILKVLFKGTSTAFVGELANFIVGCSLILPASIVYSFKKDKKHALIGCIVGTLCMTIVGTGFNAVYLLPKFAEMYGMPLDALIGMGTAINPNITGITSFVILAVAPLNLIKGTLNSVVTFLIYKHISPLLKAGNQ